MSTKSEALEKVQKSGRFKQLEAKVMEQFPDDSFQWSREELAELTGIRVSSICGTVFSLIAKGKLAVRSIGKSESSGMKVQLVGVPLEEECSTSATG